MTALADAFLRLVAAGKVPRGAWLDGGEHGRGLFGAFPDAEVEGDTLDLLDGVEALWRREPQHPWIGWLSYELGTDALLGRRGVPRRWPGLCLRRYPASIEVRGHSVIEHGDASALGDLRRALEDAERRSMPDLGWPLARLDAALDAQTYRARVGTALEHIAAGDTYQVNLSQPFFAPWHDRVADQPLAARVAGAYASLRARSPAPMGALIGHPRGWIVSNSPETLLDVRFGGAADGGDLARSWPIKGTRPRASAPAADADLARQLRGSFKDAAEHVMIVDLVRNDLGRLALPGSVRAELVPQLVTLPTVHHLVTEVRATLRPDTRLRDLIEAMFPGGSITGAPKKRTVEIIETLEHAPREIYCGSILVLEAGGLRASIAIRTAVADDRGLSLHAGGGIVADSDPESERLETIAKTRAFAPEPTVAPRRKTVF